MDVTKCAAPAAWRYNFPAVIKAIPYDPATRINQVAKINEELNEVRDALADWHAAQGEYEAACWDADKVSLNDLNDELLDERDYELTTRQHYLEEILDVVQAAETLLREFPPAEVACMKQRVIEKNALRGYYFDPSSLPRSAAEATRQSMESFIAELTALEEARKAEMVSDDEGK